MDDFYDKIFDDTYDVILAALVRSAQEPEFSLENVKAELESSCTYEGLDMDGRGEVKQAEIEGTILAYQTFILRYEKGEYRSLKTGTCK